MKTRNIMVPRNLIVAHYLHPEPYGESIVELKNGMTTDVYTDEFNTLFTPTNDDDLIKYLIKEKSPDGIREIREGELHLSSIVLEDYQTLAAWFSMCAFRRYTLIEDYDEILKQYISHSRTIHSDVLMIQVDHINVGTISFIIIDNVAIIHCEIYEYKAISCHLMDELIKMIKQYLVKTYTLKKLLFNVFEYNHYVIDALNRSEFVEKQQEPIIIPTLTGFLTEVSYEYVL